jgi:hypothetical protein
MITSAKVREIKENSVVYEQNGESRELTGIDNTIIAVGTRSNDTISEELKKTTKVVIGHLRCYGRHCGRCKGYGDQRAPDG